MKEFFLLRKKKIFCWELFISFVRGRIIGPLISLIIFHISIFLLFLLHVDLIKRKILVVLSYIFLVLKEKLKKYWLYLWVFFVFLLRKRDLTLFCLLSKSVWSLLLVLFLGKGLVWCSCLGKILVSKWKLKRKILSPSHR